MTTPARPSDTRATDEAGVETYRPDEPFPDDHLWEEDELIWATEAELEYWRVRNRRKAAAHPAPDGAGEGSGE